MTDELRGLAEIALKIIKADIERDGGGTPVFVVRTAEGRIEQLPFPKEFGFLMNSGQAKDMVFGAVRQLVREKGLTAVIMATECWVGKQTDAGKAIPEAEYLEYSRESGFITGVVKGYIERAEAVVVSVQTAVETAIITQVFERDERRHRIRFGERTEMESPQFNGRQKMFGDLSEENLR